MTEKSRSYRLTVEVQSWNPPSSIVRLFYKSDEPVLVRSGEEADILVDLLNADLSDAELELALIALGWAPSEPREVKD